MFVKRVGFAVLHCGKLSVEKRKIRFDFAADRKRIVVADVVRLAVGGEADRVGGLFGAQDRVHLSGAAVEHSENAAVDRRIRLDAVKNRSVIRPRSAVGMIGGIPGVFRPRRQMLNPVAAGRGNGGRFCFRGMNRVDDVRAVLRALFAQKRGIIRIGARKRIRHSGESRIASGIQVKRVIEVVRIIDFPLLQAVTSGGAAFIGLVRVAPFEQIIAGALQRFRIASDPFGVPRITEMFGGGPEERSRLVFVVGIGEQSAAFIEASDEIFQTACGAGRRGEPRLTQKQTRPFGTHRGVIDCDKRQKPVLKLLFRKGNRGGFLED